MWLLDTLTICEPSKTQAAPRVLDWLATQDNAALYTSSLCLGEIRRGVERLASGARRTTLRRWLDTDLPAWFGPRVLPIDNRVALLWGELTATASRTLPTVDALIAATALTHGLTVVTRNVRDYQGLEVSVFDPWSG